MPVNNLYQDRDGRSIRISGSVEWSSDPFLKISNHYRPDFCLIPMGTASTSVNGLSFSSLFYAHSK